MGVCVTFQRQKGIICSKLKNISYYIIFYIRFHVYISKFYSRPYSLEWLLQKSICCRQRVDLTIAHFFQNFVFRHLSVDMKTGSNIVSSFRRFRAMSTQKENSIDSTTPPQSALGNGRSTTKTQRTSKRGQR